MQYWQINRRASRLGVNQARIQGGGALGPAPTPGTEGPAPKARVLSSRGTVGQLSLKTGINQTRGDRYEIMSLLGLLTPVKPILSIIFMYSLSDGVKVEGASTQHMTYFQNT